ncbi:uncharacterized protein LOC133038424 [Cannabis sativa]|uniref:uncharacterized protein LOC133038424 n=1 Tax=Cannabis sativa TaxID=3483 RepID=UPI0029CA8427|nr:uncharacterized protein LOC133038424 [Cannabis sativa]
MDEFFVNVSNSLILNSEENIVFNYEIVSVESLVTISLLLCHHTICHYNCPSLMKTLSEIWSSQCRFPVVVSDHVDGLFLVTFGCEGDKGRILEGQPWHFAQSVTVFAAPDSAFPILLEQLHYVPFWVQVYGIPFMCKSHELAKFIASEIGDLVEVDQSTVREGTRQYLRIRVLLDVNLPIRRGLNVRFIKSTIGKDLVEAVLDCLNNGQDFSSINNTLIALIPKKQHAHSIQYFRPISLCNTLYKFISKVLANHLKIVLDKVVSPSQSAFVSGRVIFDNILLPQEVVHAINTRKHGRMGWVALKLDMAKAFDRVEWHFLRSIMSHFNFPQNFVSLIMKCISTTEISFLINDTVHGLSSLLRAYQDSNRLKGISISRRAPSLTHLLFANDSLIFYAASRDSCVALRDIFAIYTKVLGQAINFHKSSILFSPNVSVQIKDLFLTNLNLQDRPFISKYLGLPQFLSRSKHHSFSFLKDRVSLVLHSRHSKCFSKVGKEILLKVVIQAIPAYGMACFWLPVKLCKEIEGVMARFWWGSSGDSRKIHWKNWQSLCRSKFVGDLGFRSLIHFNQAMLAKQAWCIFTQLDSLLSLTLKARLNSCFDASTVNDILKVIFSGLDGKDEQIWGRDNSGLFIAKIWHANVPPKVKHFVWRIVSNSIPVAILLFQRHIIPSHLCPLCKNHPETILHALLECSRARKAWKASNFAHFYLQNKHWDITYFITNVFSSLGKGSADIVLCFLWTIWNQRNNAFFNRFVLDPKEMFAWCQNFLQYLDAQQKRIALRDQCDQDPSEVVVAGLVKPVSGLVAPVVAEAKAISLAVTWTKLIKLHVQSFHTDCKSIVDKLNNCNWNSSVCDDLLVDVKNSLSFSPNPRVVFVNRDLNTHAHNLAKLGLGLDKELLWNGSLLSL